MKENEDLPEEVDEKQYFVPAKKLKVSCPKCGKDLNFDNIDALKMGEGYIECGDKNV